MTFPSLPDPSSDPVEPDAVANRGNAGIKRTSAELKKQNLPPHANIMGMWLLLASLGMLFLACIAAFVAIRVIGKPMDGSENAAPVEIPRLLWLSTILMLTSSMSIHLALTSAQRQKLQDLKRWMVVTCVLAVGFLLLQTPALTQLVLAHQAAMEQKMFLNGMVFFLVLIHALHVIGGIVPLGITTYKAFANRYDHEHHQPILCLGMYWHFLDIVWVLMFLMFLLAL